MSQRTRIIIQLTAALVMFGWAFMIAAQQTQHFPRAVRFAVPLACSAWFFYFALTTKRASRQPRGFPVTPTPPPPDRRR